MGYYRVEMQGAYLAQQFQNTLYYRDRDPFTGDLIDQCNLLAGALQDHFFPAVGATLPAIVHEDYGWEFWSIMPLADIGFGPLLSAPVVNGIGVSGSAGGDPLPPGNVGIISYVLRPGSVIGGLYQPRRAYQAIGPLSEVHVGDDGRLTDAVWPTWNNAADIFAQNVGTVAGVGGWAPVRYGKNGLGIQGFAEVDDATPRRVVSYRKSRQPEA